jgi:hypothetical protein
MPTFATELWVVSKVQVPQTAARESKGTRQGCCTCGPNALCTHAQHMQRRSSDTQPLTAQQEGATPHVMEDGAPVVLNPCSCHQILSTWLIALVRWESC